MTQLKDRLRKLYVKALQVIKRNERSQDYWSRHHVDNPNNGFVSVKDSLNHLSWRNSMYPGQRELLAYESANGCQVLDYGCGPGNDIVGMGHYAKPSKLYAMDVSATALKLAKRRAELHNIPCQFYKIEETDTRLPMEDNSLDYIQAMGVLHHTPNPLAIMKEFCRLLKPGGRGRVMVYNRDSIWRHLHVTWNFQLQKGLFSDLSADQAFSRSTDGYNCPIADCYSSDTFVQICEAAGFKARLDGVAISLLELRLLPNIWDALGDKRLPEESRQFLTQIRYDNRGFPVYNNQVAGLNAFYEIEEL